MKKSTTTKQRKHHTFDIVTGNNQINLYFNGEIVSVLSVLQFINFNSIINDNINNIVIIITLELSFR